MDGRNRTRPIAALLGLSLVLLASGCRAAPDMPPEQAFALSASALSGSDRYRVDGQVAVFDPNGVLADQARYEGEITGHGNLNMKRMDGSHRMRAQAAGGPSTFQPLQLLSEVRHHTASVVYADRPFADGTVRLKLTLTPDTARRRIADELRAELKSLRSDTAGRPLGPEQRRQALTVLDRADRQLASALSTLKVTTVCLWTADRQTWFPRKMTEDTRLTYQWNGRTYREQRLSETNFVQGGTE